MKTALFGRGTANFEPLHIMFAWLDRSVKIPKSTIFGGGTSNFTQPHIIFASGPRDNIFVTILQHLFDLIEVLKLWKVLFWRG